MPDPNQPDPDTVPPRATGLAADYHQRTKHAFEAYARGPQALDWDDQPAPFRTYGHPPDHRFARRRPEVTPPFTAVAHNRPAAPRRPDEDSLGELFWQALAVSAWKRYGDARWALRCNPSSGNLHPTEAYVVTGGHPGIDAGLYLYRPEDHGLERRCAYMPAFAERLPPDGFLIGLSSIAWREAWKYGERAWRYCQLDLGHALAALRYAAATLGWRVEPLWAWSDDDIARLLGLDRAGEFPEDEPERAEVLLAVGPRTEGQTSTGLNTDLTEAAPAQAWRGAAARLSLRHDHRWPVIDAAALSATRPRGARPPGAAEPLVPIRGQVKTLSAHDLIRARRSAQQMDGTTGIRRTDFLNLLDRLLPRPGLPPWGDTPAQPRVHLGLLVHRVEGLDSGLYLLSRHARAARALSEALREEFLWQAVPDSPPHLPLHLLVAARAQRTAARLACQQAIAADGAFCVAMLAEFDAGLAAGGWGYRELLREAGLIGQTLYLEAEALGLQGTGIGCFFDDPLHELLGIRDTRYQVVYQFTVGRAREDGRITTEPAYGPLEAAP